MAKSVAASAMKYKNLKGNSKNKNDWISAVLHPYDVLHLIETV